MSPTATNPMAFDLSKEREGNPGYERVLHFKNAGASLTPRLVPASVVNRVKLISLTHVPINGGLVNSPRTRTVTRSVGSTILLPKCYDIYALSDE